jgi:cGMP-dependent protein kinase
MVNPFGWLMKRRKQRQEKKKHEKALRAEEEALVKHITDSLKEIPLLSNLSDAELLSLAGSFNLRSYEPGEYVMRAGENGDEFYFIHEGTAEVLTNNEDGDETKVVTLRHADYFGEQALLTDSVRNASIRATSDLQVLVLNRQQFRSLTTSGEVMFAQRRAVVAEDVEQDVVPETHEYDSETLAFVKQSIKENLLFKDSEESLINRIVPYFTQATFNAGEVIIAEGEADATKFYCIQTGECQVSSEKAGDIVVLKDGSTFGELALLYNAPRNATVTAIGDVSVFVMERSAYRYVNVTMHQEEDDSRFGFLRSVKLFQPLLANEITLIDMALTARQCQPGEKIFNQGDAPDFFFIVKEGTCEGKAVKDNDESEEFIKNVGGFFGELALLNDEPRNATIHAGEVGCTLLQLSREDFNQLLGPLRNILDRNAKQYELPVNDRRLLDEDSSKICSLAELQTIGLLGRGAFGKVTLVVDPNTKKSYALKAIKKKQIHEIGQSAHIVNEKRVMMMMNSRFLVNLRRTYKDDWRVYFLVDVCLGGELFTILRKKRSFNEDQTRFYIACVVEAFDYMHSMNIIYRDLKPENLVMDTTGYIKVTDFGFAKVVPKKTYTLCGTPDYLAPEIVTGQGHGKGVDWWCLGVLAYELLSSFPPFFDDEPMGTYRKIIQGKFKFPKYFSSDVRVTFTSLTFDSVPAL